MANDSRTTRQLLEALGFKYSQGDHDSLVRAALRELEELRAAPPRIARAPHEFNAPHREWHVPRPANG